MSGIKVLVLLGLLLDTFIDAATAPASSNCGTQTTTTPLTTSSQCTSDNSVASGQMCCWVSWSDTSTTPATTKQYCQTFDNTQTNTTIASSYTGLTDVLVICSGFKLTISSVFLLVIACLFQG